MHISPVRPDEVAAVVGRGIAEPPTVPTILTTPGTFAGSVFQDRHPKLIAQLRAAHPYPPGQHQALADLLDETLTGRISPLPRTAHDHAVWDLWGDGYAGESWYDVPFLWAESYFYRRLLQATGFFVPGPWFWIDPFEFLKTAELRDPTLGEELDGLDAVLRLPDRERLDALLLAALWGNRADLGFRIGLAAATSQPAVASLVADDTAAVSEALRSGAARRVAVLADNAGRELIADLALIDHLITTGLADEVVLHLKPGPYYVSDAGTADLAGCLRRLAAATGAAAGVAQRLHQALADGRVTVYTHWFYCAPFSFHHMPDDLAQSLGSMSLAILKGDLNYRRLVGDCDWPAATPFATAVGYFPTPVVALRALKSDVVVGLDDGTVSALDDSAYDWRVSGTHGMVQALL